MSWEAYRWTAKSPSELLTVLGPQGVDELLRQAMNACWRESPAEGRSLATVLPLVREVFDRNIKVWASIKKPSPAAFFENLLPNAADGFFRQAMVLCWMMMPRTGGRDVADVRTIISEIFQRNLDAWTADNETFTKGRAKRVPSRKIQSKKRVGPKPIGKRATRKEVPPGPRRARRTAR